mgnify:FL=1
MSADSGPGAREIARRLFAAEFDDASLSYSESDEERAPNYVVTPTGARVNRLFAVGVLTEVEQVNEDSLRGRVVDPTGAFVTYAGQYQPDEHAFLSHTEPPTFVALAGKARTFEPEDSDRVFTSVRPESLNEVDADTRDRWVVSAARRTLHRIAVFTEALSSNLHGEALQSALETAGVDASLAAGIPRAIDHYGTGPAYLEAVRSLAVEAVEQVAGERDAVGTLETLPDDETPTELGPLPAVDVSLAGFETSETAEPEASAEAETETTETESEAESAEPESTETTEPVTETAAQAESAETTPDTSEDSEPEEPAAADESAAEETEPEPAGSEPEPADTESEAETSEVEPETSDAGDDELGDFDGESVQETVEQEAEELGDFDPSETLDDGPESSAPGAQSDAAASDDESEALSEAERKEVEEEFGAEFSTGSEVGDPGEAGIDVPTSEEELEELEEEVTGEAAEPDESEADEADAEEPADSPADVDLESVVVETMSNLDDGDGVPQETVVEAVVDEHGADAGAVEDAIQDAMMSGKCYEPDEGTLKAI